MLGEVGLTFFPKILKGFSRLDVGYWFEFGEIELNDRGEKQ